MGRILFSQRDARRAVLGPPPRAPFGFHRSLPGYAPSALREAPRLAAQLGLARVWVKDESSRFGLPAFKILGASWAIWRALGARAGASDEEAPSLDALRARAAALGALQLVAATDGNHGRGVARVARWLGLPAAIFVPGGTARARIEAIASEGARVVEVEGSYDETVARAAAAQGAGCVLIQDHAWPGYEEVPRWVIEGYATIFWEIEQQLRGERPLDLVLVQVGVGALAAAAADHYRRPGLVARPALASVEPSGAACALASIEAGRIVTLPAGAHSSILAGLNCGTPSSVAWPALERGIDVFVAVDDERARAGVRALAADDIVSGETGAAGAAGLLELLAGEGGEAARERLELGRDGRVLLLSTEGATDPASWQRIVGRPPECRP
jgi:diaminopropionate ammonia-lyase